ncbi:MAG TPA: transcription-repair coupling factor [Treponema sp.]|nr:transcription-repair coupling factor [Treponema sp.]
MNTLSANSIKVLIRSWPEMRNGIAALSDDSCGFPATVRGLQGAMYSYFTAEYCRQAAQRAFLSFQYTTGKKRPQAEIRTFDSHSYDTVIVVPGEHESDSLAADLATVFPEAETVVLPWWGMIPYRPAAKGAAVFGERAAALAKLAVSDISAPLRKRPRIFILTQRVFQSPLPPPGHLRSHTFRLEKGQQINTVKTAEMLASLGFMRVPRVSVRGEFSLRGEVLDIFLPGDDSAVRIIFDFDTIGNIRSFDAETQSTTGTLESVLVVPMKEVIWDTALVDTLRKRLADYESTAVSGDEERNQSEDDSSVHLPFTGAAKEKLADMIAELEAGRETEGEELFYPVLWDRKYSIADYISENTPVFFFDYDRLVNAEESISREYGGMYRRSRAELPVLPPSEMVMNFRKMIKTFSRCIFFRTLSQLSDTGDDKSAGDDASSDIVFSCEPARSFFGNINFLKDELGKLQKDDWKIFIFADGENQSLRIKEILRDYTGAKDTDDPSVKDTSPEYLNPVTVLPEAISEGFSVPDIKLLVIQENEIFGRRRYVPKSLHKVKSAAIDTFVELNPGDYVVHVEYGIGIFRGIERVKAAGNERDYIKLEYADSEYAFVPIEQVNMVQRYIGSEGEAPKIDRIGSKNWENRKNKVQKAVEDLAQKLIDLYSRRKASPGFPFPKDTEWQASFEAAFPYEDTPDQASVSEEVKRDMEKPVPMDRLVCGDVGYGKTEIAMRAAFKAVMGGKQVAFLAPTTILAEQHYETCLDRFRDFPVKIAQLSRFVSPAEQKKTLAKLAAGEVDILIGTHRIIQKDVVFRNLGLMIIDEEQRFGVKDKDKLKEMRTNIDCLALSATPIPRTLHMSLLKIRDMSLLTTPPQNRQSIETVIEPYNDVRVAAAVRREVERGGQVFYLHNRGESLQDTCRKLEQLLPEMLIDAAHGQMTSEQLDDIFRRFKLGGFHVLVATTIIENGIDIPNVNTIIIDRADMYGVSQLYQLRGRVGRSDRKAYAYLFYPQNVSLSEVAMKRLQVISDFTELGSGFKIAMKDMEIRGAGNLLGKDQSGDVYSVGFELYLKLLNEAVERLTMQKDYKAQNEVLMEMEYTGFIPDSYVQNTQTKMEIYKKIASIQTDDELGSVINELGDRFGPVPDEVSSLLSLAEIRILCRKLNISSIKEHQGVVAVSFSKVSDISVDKVLRLIKESAGSVTLDPTHPNMMFLKLGKIGLKEKSEFIREKLDKIA